MIFTHSPSSRFLLISSARRRLQRGLLPLRFDFRRTSSRTLLGILAFPTTVSDLKSTPDAPRERTCPARFIERAPAAAAAAATIMAARPGGHVLGKKRWRRSSTTGQTAGDIPALLAGMADRAWPEEQMLNALALILIESRVDPQKR